MARPTPVPQCVVEVRDDTAMVKPSRKLHQLPAPTG
jgi:hypothetical protein